jgi:hypothetical protein
MARRKSSILRDTHDQEVLSEFLNVDLDIKSPTDPAPLKHAFGKRVHVMHADKVGRKHWLRLMLWPQPETPDEAIRRFSKLVARLGPRARVVWKRATKEFDIGIQGGFEPRSAEWVLDHKTMAMAGRLGANLRITVYSPTMVLEAQRRREGRTT